MVRKALVVLKLYWTRTHPVLYLRYGTCARRLLYNLIRLKTFQWKKLPQRRNLIRLFASHLWHLRKCNPLGPFTLAIVRSSYPAIGWPPLYQCISYWFLLLLNHCILYWFLIPLNQIILHWFLIPLYQCILYWIFYSTLPMYFMCFLIPLYHCFFCCFFYSTLSIYVRLSFSSNYSIVFYIDFLIPSNGFTCSNMTLTGRYATSHQPSHMSLVIRIPSSLKAEKKETAAQLQGSSRRRRA